MRKYGLACDHVLDARLINASGKMMDKDSMGEDVFWALRGGGGGCWGVVYAWKIQLVSLPPVLTVFKVPKTGADIVTETVLKWQYVAPQTEEDLFIRVELRVKNESDSADITASFHGIYLGCKNELLSKIANIFPELRMEPNHCDEMSWINSVCYFDGIKQSELTNWYADKIYFKVKSDFAKVPLPESALRGLWAIMAEETSAYTAFSPLGGMMGRIPSSATPFPQRAETLFDIHYNTTWRESSRDNYYLEWMRKLYKYMEPYVSSSPRAAYVNFLDLDLGSSCNGQASIEEARVWGENYFDANFDRLVKAKTQVDPYNHFRNPQGIPPLPN
ncbi:berberine bridge enzyme-like 26 [Cryptomeria japonica]|uniref:berberine bridge enzyme-like 26 n=1 Tax=Cryptomeria japonica TaxID=3369 RepID=UPI0027DA4FEA|nr:berberine bridge enzyme-like 26 [Cryptomeria japonica]